MALTLAITDNNLSAFMDDLEAQHRPFSWELLASRVYGLYVDGEETPIHIILSDDGTWEMKVRMEV